MGSMGLGEFLFSLSGRISRGGFWIGAGIQLAILIVIGGIAAVSNARAVQVILAVVYVVTMFWIGLAISVKRWHDRGKSGWWVLISLVPIVGIIWAFIETALLPGDQGPNIYGPDPLA